MKQDRREPRWLTATEVQQLVEDLDRRKLTRGMLQHYAVNAYVQPRPVTTAFGQRGRPSSVGYSLTDVVLLRWLLRLSAEGISLKQFADGIRALRRLMPDALAKPDDLRFFVVDRRQIAVQTRDQREVQLTGAVGQVLLTFTSVPLVKDTVRRAEEIIDARLAPASAVRRGRR